MHRWIFHTPAVPTTCLFLLTLLSSGQVSLTQEGEGCLLPVTSPRTLFGQSPGTEPQMIASVQAPDYKECVSQCCGNSVATCNVATFMPVGGSANKTDASSKANCILYHCSNVRDCNIPITTSDNDSESQQIFAVSEMVKAALATTPAVTLPTTTATINNAEATTVNTAQGASSSNTTTTPIVNTVHVGDSKSGEESRRGGIMDGPGNNLTTAQSVTVTPEPTTPQPLPQQPTTPQPLPQQPTTPQPLPQQPTTPQPLPQQPTTPQPTSLQPSTQQPTTQQAQDKTTKGPENAGTTEFTILSANNETKGYSTNSTKPDQNQLEPQQPIPKPLNTTPVPPARQSTSAKQKIEATTTQQQYSSSSPSLTVVTDGPKTTTAAQNAPTNNPTIPLPTTSKPAKEQEPSTKQTTLTNFTAEAETLGATNVNYTDGGAEHMRGGNSTEQGSNSASKQSASTTAMLITVLTVGCFFTLVAVVVISRRFFVGYKNRQYQRLDKDYLIDGMYHE